MVARSPWGHAVVSGYLLDGAAVAPSRQIGVTAGKIPKKQDQEG